MLDFPLAARPLFFGAEGPRVTGRSHFLSIPEAIAGPRSHRSRSPAPGDSLSREGRLYTRGADRNKARVDAVALAELETRPSTKLKGQ